MATLILPENYPGSTGEYIYKKNKKYKDRYLPSNFSPGWWVIGNHGIYETTYSGTVSTGDKYIGQSELSFVVFLGSKRSTLWEYIGGDAFFGTDENNESSYVFFDAHYDYRNWEYEAIVFMGCDPEELDCGDCCISCCNLAQKLLNKLS